MPEVTSAGSPMGHARMGTIWMIASVAALGGLLFGYDWVVIGGARPFFQVYFALRTEAVIGWANSCALVGCLIGAICAGVFSQVVGRRPLLRFSALLFIFTSILTGFSYSFFAFVTWRICGGVAIGLASSLTPIYIAEISPAAWRGRLVSMNQLAMVVGILGGQLINWKIAQPVPANVSLAAFAVSWNVQHAWRWMFAAVAVPSLVFLTATAAIPESPRWLLQRGNAAGARSALRRLGDAAYTEHEIAGIERSLSGSRPFAWRTLLTKPRHRSLLLAVTLAVLQQWSGVNVLFNYAQEVYGRAGHQISGVFLDIVLTGAINLAFTVLAMVLVDRFGRKPLMLGGLAGIACTYFCAAWALRAGSSGAGVLVITLCAIACYAASLAPVTWVLITELFQNEERAQGVSVAVAVLWFASFCLTDSFPLLNKRLGTAGVFSFYGGVCILGFFFVLTLIPETIHRSLDASGPA